MKSKEELNKIKNEMAETYVKPYYDHTGYSDAFKVGFEAAIAITQEEIDKWKWEYENLCQFPTDFEDQRDQYKDDTEKLKLLLEDK